MATILPVPQYEVPLNGMINTEEVDQEIFRIGDWRKTYGLTNPNGSAPITAITALMKNSRTTDPEFTWNVRVRSRRAFTPLGYFTDQALTVPLSATVTEGDIFYIQGEANEIREFQLGSVVLLSDLAGSLENFVRARVQDRQFATGANYLQVLVLQSTTVPVDIAVQQRAIAIGNMNPEGGILPLPIIYEPKILRNVTQIFRNSYKLTRTLMQTKLRDDFDYYRNAKDGCLRVHMEEMEKAFIFNGAPTLNPASYNGEVERSTGGLTWMATQGGFVDDARDSSLVTGVPVGTDFRDKSYGLQFIDRWMEEISLYGANQKMILCGSGAFAAFTYLARELGYWRWETSTTVYGMTITRWTGPNGTFILQSHPLMSQEPAFRYSAIALEPAMLHFRYIQDTKFIADDWSDQRRLREDGEWEEYLTEAGLEYDNPITLSYVSGIGLPRTAAPTTRAFVLDDLLNDRAGALTESVRVGSSMVNLSGVAAVDSAEATARLNARMEAEKAAQAASQATPETTPSKGKASKSKADEKDDDFI